MNSDDPEWKWEARYTDGTVLKQYGDTYHKFDEIEQDRLHSFWMVHEERAPIVIQWRPHLKLIQFFYRVRHIVSDSTKIIRLHCIGYQERGDKWLMVIMPDGGIVITDDIEKVKIE